MFQKLVVIPAVLGAYLSPNPIQNDIDTDYTRLQRGLTIENIPKVKLSKFQTFSPDSSLGVKKGNDSALLLIDKRIFSSPLFSVMSEQYTVTEIERYTAGDILKTFFINC